jgi:hypothetical protein
MLSCFVNLSYAETITTTLSRDKVALGEPVTLTFTLNSTAVNFSPDFAPLERDFHILATNYSTAINSVNGVTESQLSWQVTLVAKVTGEFLIPEISFGQIKSQVRKLTVTKFGVTTSADEDGQDQFVQAQLSTKTPYVQGQVIYTFKLFYRSHLESPGLQLPQVKEAMMMPIGTDQHYQTTINGKQFFVFEKKFALFPQKPGKLVIPATYFRAQSVNLNSNAMFDPFALASSKLVSLETQAFNIEVKNIPETVSAKDWLPAKKVLLREKWSVAPQHWELGNPVIRTLTIEALGLRADQIESNAFA